MMTVSIRRTILRAAAALGFLIAATAPLRAYEISPRMPIHEALTALAEECLDQYGGAEPYDCSGYFAEHLAHFASLDYRSPVYATSMASRWPDDPDRMLHGAGIIRFGLVFLSCNGRVRERSGIDRVGLLCSVHHGQLLFVQAMRSRPDESTAETQAAILDWVGLVFDAALGRVPHDDNFCSYFESRGGPASAALLAGFQSCGDSDAREGNDGWTVATLFTRHCSYPFGGCRTTHGDEARREMRSAARGALLHLVHDSFAQGHTQRGEEATPIESRIICRPVVVHRAMERHHSHGDLLPTLDESCSDPVTRSIDDPITAGARLLWLMQERRPAAEAQQYFRERVLG